MRELLELILKSRTLLNRDLKIKFNISIVYMLIAMFLEMLGISLIIPLISLLVSNSKPIIQFGNIYLDYFQNLATHLNINYLLLLFFITYFFKFLFMIYNSFYQSSFIFSCMAYISEGLYKKYINNTYLFIKKNNSSFLLRNLVNESSQFSKGIVNSLLIIFTELVTILGLMTILFFVQPFGLLFSIIVFFFSIKIFYYITTSKIRMYGEQKQKFEGMRIKSINQTFDSFDFIKTASKEDIFTFIYKNYLEKVVYAARNQQFINQLPRYWLEFVLITITILLTIFFFNYKDNNNTIAQISIFLIAGIRLLPSINKIVSSYQTLLYSKPSLEVICEHFFLKDEIHKQKSNFEFSKIKFKDIKFSYGKDREFKIDNFTISKNEIIGIKGISGSGKTTLIRILIGLIYKKDFGIYLNDESKKIDAYPIKNLFGYVPQNTLLIDESLKFNITLSNSQKADDEIFFKKVLKITQVEDLISTLEKKQDTYIGEKGSNISGGQMQRIGIARAIYLKPKILILDESTSGMDINLEKKVIKNLINSKIMKTIIIISHRTSTFEYCNRIIEIKDGKIFFQSDL